MKALAEQIQNLQEENAGLKAELGKTETIAMQVQLSTEYLACMAEINTLGGERK